MLMVAVAFGVYAFAVVPLVQSLTAPDTITLTPSEYAAVRETTAEPPTGDEPAGEQYITIKWLGLFPIKKVLVNVLPFDRVLVGGLPVGICGTIDGVLVTAPSPDGVLRTGDLIHAVNGTPVANLTQYTSATAGLPSATLTCTRNNRTVQKTVALDQTLNLRDQTTGVGILTMVNPDNHTYTALGHQMTDFATGAAVDLTGGAIKPVKHQGLIKTQGHETGVIQNCIANTDPIGSITRGTAFGVTGCLTPDSALLTSLDTTLPVATRYHVKPGAATLRTSLDGQTVEEFTCEIIKARYQDQRRAKSMVIRITDERLLDQTGGIVHGMSGSPIIQNGHLVGALTHAITHDPSKGYAVYIDFVTI